MQDFIYDVPVKVYFGENQLGNLAKELQVYGKRVLLTYGGGSIKKIGLYDKVVAEIKKAGLTLFELGGIAPNPKIESVREGVKICKENKVDVLLAVGGGSTIDATKAIGAGAVVDFDAWEFYAGDKKIENGLPIISILTNSATGSEMNVNSVISNMETNEKYGAKGLVSRPKVSFLDPTVTYSVNAYHTACGAADIISHIFEVYFNLNPDLYMLDTVMEGLIKTVVKFAPIAIKEPTNYEARANLMWASTWALNGFIRGGKTGGWSSHPIEHELSAYYDITHGLGLAIITPRWMKYCLSEKTAWRYRGIGENVFGLDKGLSDMAMAEKTIEKMEEFLFKTLNLKSTLTDIGIDETYFEIMAKKSCNYKEINGFITLTPADVVNILKMCL